MQSIRILFSISFFTAYAFMLSTGCQQVKKDDAGKTLTEEIETADASDTEEGYKRVELQRSLSDERRNAQIMLEERSVKWPEASMMLISKRYAIDHRMVVNETVQTDPITGEFLDFKDDFSYEWIKKDTLSEKGKYHYSFESDRLIMLPDDTTRFPSEWTVKSGGDVIVLVGTSRYYNNNTQIHMIGSLK